MMKSTLSAILFISLLQLGFGQEKLNPVIKDFGGIWDIPQATVKADHKADYKIVIDVNSGPDSPDKLNPALNNVARMLNLHVVSGANPDKIHVVLAIHASATYAIMDNAAYLKKYGVENPNIELIRQLKAADVKLTVCGQSLIAREVPFESVLKEVEVGTSMLTTVTTFQNKGYAYLNF
jgi:intracellular sulfur oxidation DsrE/DsrF family protein